jgi:putative ABC transport system substrate-binding protein
MVDQGYVEGKNVTYVYSGAASSLDKLEPDAQNLVVAKVDLIVALGTPAAQAAKKVTTGTSVPIVFLPVSDPVTAGIVQSIANPGGNLTGIATGVEVHGLRLQWLLKVAPNVKRVYVPYDTGDAATAAGLKAVQNAAAKLGVELVTREIRNADDVTATIADIPGKVDGVFLLAGTIVGTHMNDFITVSLQNKLPLSAPMVPQVSSGALLSYGFDNQAIGKQATRLAVRILKGAKPADLPVETSEFFLSINLKTAQAIGLTVPDDILRQAATIVR